MRWIFVLVAAAASLGSVGCLEAGPGREPAVPGQSDDTWVGGSSAGGDRASSGEHTAAGVPFIEVATGEARLSDPLPMIVALHGRGGSPQNTRSWFDGLRGVNARLIIPYGHSFRAGYSWWDERLSDGEEAFAGGVARAEARVAAAVRELIRTRPTLGRPIFTGFSQGGTLSYTVAVRDPDIVGMAIPMSGQLMGPLTPQQWAPLAPRPPVHAFHGDADQTVAVTLGRNSVARLHALGLDSTMTELRGTSHQVGPQLSYMYAEVAQAARAQASAGVVATAPAAAPAAR